MNLDITKITLEIILIILQTIDLIIVRNNSRDAQKIQRSNHRQDEQLAKMLENRCPLSKDK